MVELADGGSSGKIDSTYTIYVTSRVEWCYRRDLRPSGGGTSTVMAARPSSGARCRRRQAMAASTEHGMSYRGSLQCYPGKERRTREFPATPTTAASTPTRTRPWRRWREWTMRPYQSSNGSAARWTRGRGLRWRWYGGDCTTWASFVLPMAPAWLRRCAVLAAGDKGESRKLNESAGGSERVRGVLRRVAARRGLAR